MGRSHDVVIGGTCVEVEELGAGAPVVVVQTALTRDELVPLSRELGATLHVWHVRRPGYGRSGPARVPGSVEADADLVAAVVDRVVAGPAHLVGASYSAAVALTLAARHPDAVRSLALLEPPPYGTPGAVDFRAATAALAETCRRSGTAAALDELMQMIGGRAWRADAERDLPGAVAAMERDAGTFFGSDLPALLGWTLDDERTAGISCPTLLVGGAASHSWFAGMLDRLERVVPTTRRASISGAGHTMALTHPAEVGAEVLAHVRDISPGRPAGGKGADHS